MKKHSLTVTARELTGKQVKTLRAQGLVPASIYGKGIPSVSVSMNEEEFLKVYKEAGETGVIELSLGDEKRPVLVHTVQVDAVGANVLHVEFYQVNMKQKVHAKIPLEFEGESPAVAQKVGVLLTVLDEVEVEALPGDLVDHISVDVTGMAEVNQEITVKDLVIPSGIELLTDVGLTVVKVGSLITKEAEAEAAADEAVKAEAATDAAAEAGAAAPTDQPAAEPSEKSSDEGK